jgi:outer membrane protein assembly factor BamB
MRRPIGKIHFLAVMLAMACECHQTIGRSQMVQKDETARATAPARVVTGLVNSQRTGMYAESGIHSVDALVWKSNKLFSFKSKTFGGWLHRTDFPDGGYIISSQPLYRPSDSFYCTTPLLANGLIYFSFYVGTGYLVAIDAATGNVKWHFKKDYAQFSDPAIVGNTVYIRTDYSGLYALDADTGQEKWFFEGEQKTRLKVYIPYEYLGNWLARSSPAIWDGVVYFGSLNGYFYALDAATRQPKWVFPTSGILTLAAIADDTAFFGSSEGYLYAVNTRTGQERWKIKVHAQSPAVNDGVVYFNDEENLYAVDARTGTSKWKAKAGSKVGTPLAIDNDTVYFCGLKQNLYAANLKTGLEKWKFKTKEPCDTPVIAGGLVYIGSFEKLYAVNARDGQQQWVIDAAKSNLSSPAIGNGVIYFVRDDGHLYSAR